MQVIERFNQRLREAGGKPSALEQANLLRECGGWPLNESTGYFVRRTACDEDVRESRMRGPSTTREIASAPVDWLAAEGIPTIGRPAPSDPDVAHPRGEPRMTPMRAAGVATPTSTRTGTDAGERVDCPSCDDGTRDDGTPCPKCRGVGWLLRADGETQAASAVQRLAESAVQTVGLAAGVPLRGDDLDVAATFADDDKGPTLDGGALDLRREGVSMTAAADEPDTSNLIDLTRDGVPSVKLEHATAEEVLPRDPQEAREEAEARR